MSSSDPDYLRRKYAYRRLIQGGKIRMRLGAAQKLIGPDCAYHLYGHFDSQQQEAGRSAQPNPKEENS